VLRSIHHRNLLPILTACSTVDNTGNVFKALVYSFMANGNLDRWLHHKGDRKSYKPLNRRLCGQKLSTSNISSATDENAVQQCLVSVLEVALSCVNPMPAERMTMKETTSRIGVASGRRRLGRWRDGRR
jgi:hypothetical protein